MGQKMQAELSDRRGALQKVRSLKLKMTMLKTLPDVAKCQVARLWAKLPVSTQAAIEARTGLRPCSTGQTFDLVRCAFKKAASSVKSL